MALVVVILSQATKRKRKDALSTFSLWNEHWIALESIEQLLS